MSSGENKLTRAGFVDIMVSISEDGGAVPVLTQEDKAGVQKRLERMQRENPFLPVNQMVCALIREDILTCRLEPGAWMNEEQCARHYSASRTTVRKAFDTLLEEGWLKKDDGHVRVSNILREDYLDLMEYRAIIEPAACRLAARNRNREDLRRLERYVELCDTAEITALYASDTAFHEAVFAASKNSYLAEAYGRVRRKLDRGKIYTAEDFGDVYKDVYREHRAIFAAIRDGNEELARRLGRQHIKMMLDSRIIRKPREPD